MTIRVCPPMREHERLRPCRWNPLPNGDHAGRHRCQIPSGASMRRQCDVNARYGTFLISGVGGFCRSACSLQGLLG